MDLTTAERLISVSDPKGVSALRQQSNDPAAAKAVAGQFGALLMQGMMQSGNGEAIPIAGDGIGGNVISGLFASMVSQAAMSGDKLGLADILFRSIEAKQHPEAAGSQTGQLASGASPTQHSTDAPQTVPTSAKGFPLSPYWDGNGLRPLGSTPSRTRVVPPGGLTPARPGKAGAVDSHGDVSPTVGWTAPFSSDPVSLIASQTTPSAQIQSFVQQLGPLLQEAGRQLAVSPKILLAQAALETGWGRSVVGNNVFGIKAGASWTGSEVTTMTHEVEAGQTVSRQASFRAYPTLDAAVQDYVALIRNCPRYRAVIGVGNDAAAYGQALLAGGYATDNQYAQKIEAIAAGPSAAAAFSYRDEPHWGGLFASGVEPDDR